MDSAAGLPQDAMTTQNRFRWMEQFARERTENSKSSALVIRLRVRPRSVGQPTTPEGRSPYIYLTSTLHLSLLDQSPIDRLTGSFDTLIAEVILDRSRE